MNDRIPSQDASTRTPNEALDCDNNRSDRKIAFRAYLCAIFTVSDIDETLTTLRKHGAQLVGEVVQYEGSYRLCYIRGPEGLLIGLAEPSGVIGNG